MNETNSLKALFNPGEADDFFQIKDLPAFDPAAVKSYSEANALWLSEASRLVYREDEPSRKAYFKRVGLEEVHFFDQGATRGALVIGRGFAILVFRGTLGPRDVLSDLDFPAVGWEGHGLVHEGFKRQLDAVWLDATVTLGNIKTPIFYTGHSLGAALATLAAARRFLEKGASPAAVYSYGSPRVGTTEFSSSFPDGFLHCRMVNDRDIVPTLPPRKPSLALDFHHVGSPFYLGPGGELKQGTLNEDPADSSSAVVELAMLTTSIAEVVAGRSTLLLGRLIDHTPVNYTARIERAAAS
jgi:triacylglycerol lipase